MKTSFKDRVLRGWLNGDEAERMNKRIAVIAQDFNTSEDSASEAYEFLKRKYAEFFGPASSEREEEMIDWLEDNEGEHIVKLVPSVAEFVDNGVVDHKLFSIHFRLRTAYRVGYARHIQHGNLPVALGRKIETVIEEAKNGKSIAPTNAVVRSSRGDFREEVKRSEYMRLDLKRVVEIWPHGDESKKLEFDLNRDRYREEMAFIQAKSRVNKKRFCILKPLIPLTSWLP